MWRWGEATARPPRRCCTCAPMNWPHPERQGTPRARWCGAGTARPSATRMQPKTRMATASARSSTCASRDSTPTRKRGCTTTGIGRTIRPRGGIWRVIRWGWEADRIHICMFTLYRCVLWTGPALWVRVQDFEVRHIPAGHRAPPRHSGHLLLRAKGNGLIKVQNLCCLQFSGYASVIGFAWTVSMRSLGRGTSGIYRRLQECSSLILRRDQAREMATLRQEIAASVLANQARKRGARHADALSLRSVS
jgi:hypothetical protein